MIMFHSSARVWLITATLVATLGARAAEAQQVARSRPGFQLLIPSFKLSGSTDQKGKLKAALPMMAGWGPVNLVLTPRVEVASSEGLSILFSEQATLPWQAGATLSAIVPAIGDSGDNTQIINDAKIALYNACIPACEKDSNCVRFTRATPDIEKTVLSPEKLCPSSRSAWGQFERGMADAPDLFTALYDSCAVQCEGPGCQFSLEAPLAQKLSSPNLCPLSQGVASRYLSQHPIVRGRFPLLRISGGAQAGSEKFTWLDGGTEPTTTLSEVKEKKSSLKAGLSVATVFTSNSLYGLTLELHGLVESKWKPSDDTARVCKPVGTLEGAPAEQCSETALGTPTNVHKYSVAVDVGLVERFDGRWRAALGALWEPTTRDKRARFALRVPIYLNFATAQAPTGYSGEYKGMLRITPMLSFSKEPDLGIVPAGFVTVEVLGDASLFPEALDYL